MESFSELISRIPDSIYTREQDSDIYKLFSMYADVFDSLKDVADQIRVMKSISEQEGVILDEIGKILKEARKGRSDEEYRNYLMIAIQRNISNGSLPTVADIVKMIIPGDCDYNLYEVNNIYGGFLDGLRLLDGTYYLDPSPPAAVKLEVSGDISGTEFSYLTGAVEQIKAAGVEFEYEIT